METIADTIWQVPAYLPYLQPPLTDEVIAAAERYIGFALPTEYLNLLRTQNGGYIRFSLPDMVHDIIAGIGPYFPSLTGYDWHDCQDYVSYPLNGLVPFDGDGHWHLCLDYRTDPANPSVTCIDIECDHQTEIAASFADYLALLRVEVRDEYVLESVADIEAVKSQLSSALGVEFEPADTWAHGYPVQCAVLGTADDPQRLWLSPNTVPRGFVRSNDPRYAELKNLMPGNARRYPELPAKSFVLFATEGVRATVLDACMNLRPGVRPLREFINAT